MSCILAFLNNNCIALASFIVLISLVIFTYKTYRSIKKSLLHKILADIQSDYRSPQMLLAVEALWDFYRECEKKYGEEYKKEYEKKRKKENKKVNKQKINKKIKYKAGTLHHQRRLVSQFYNHLATLYDNKIISEKIVFDNWHEADLQIIPKIIIPIENKLRKVLNDPPLEPLDDKDKLNKLYDASINYEENKNNAKII